MKEYFYIVRLLIHAWRSANQITTSTHIMSNDDIMTTRKKTCSRVIPLTPSPFAVAAPPQHYRQFIKIWEFFFQWPEPRVNMLGVSNISMSAASESYFSVVHVRRNTKRIFGKTSVVLFKPFSFSFFMTGHGAPEVEITEEEKTRSLNPAGSVRKT